MDEAPSATETRVNWRVIGAFILLSLVLHLATNHRYGYHADELYFIACGNHLDLGYVDHPPLFPALASVLSLMLVGLITGRAGGGKFAQAIACTAFLFAPVFLRTGNMLSIPSFEPVFWLGASYVLLRIVQGGDARLWVLLGAIAGVGLMNKHTMLFYGMGLAVAIIATPLRKHLLTPWPYLGGVAAFLLFLPNIAWQVMNDWPTLEFIRMLNESRMSEISRGEFIAGQVLYHGPLAAPLWIAGIVFSFTKRGRELRPFAIIYLTVLTILLITQGKAYYSSPAYPALFAAGAVALQVWTQSRGRVLQPVYLGTIAVGGLLFLPLSLPVMHVNTTDKYVQVATMGLMENSYELTGDLHAMFGWKERAELVAAVYETLSPEEQAGAVILCPSYSVAGAMDLYREELGLPPAVSPHLSYHRWGLPDKEITVVIGYRFSPESLEQYLGDVRVAATFEHPLVNPWQSNVVITVCRDPKVSLHELWPKMYDVD